MLLVVPVSAFAELSNVSDKKIPLLLVNSGSDNSVPEETVRNIDDLVKKNIIFTDYFELVKTLPEMENINEIPDFRKWSEFGIEFLVDYEVQKENEDLYINLSIWDVNKEKQILSKSFKSEFLYWYKIANLISDSIYEVITGNSPFFDSYIVYVEEGDRRSIAGSNKILNITDYAGNDNKVIETNSTLNMMPAFCLKSKIAYVSYEKGFPGIYMIDLNSGEKKDLYKSGVFSISPSCSDKGDLMLFSASTNGNTDIFSIDLKTGAKKQLTTNTSIDVSASYSPDGNNIVFSSDRSGSEQIYIMDKNGHGIKRISFGEKGVSYSSPSWSPSGRKIAFTKNKNGKQQLGIMDFNGKNEVILTQGYLDNNPVFFSEKYLMFYRETVKTGIVISYEILTININTGVKTSVKTKADSSEFFMFYIR